MTSEAPAKTVGRNPLTWAIPLAVAIALAGTADMIFREDVRLLFGGDATHQGNDDIEEILRHAQSATGRDIARWWSGTWIEESSPYYRPLASIFIYGEYLAFGRQWRPYCLVTWFMHAGLCVPMLLLMARLFDHWPPARRVWPGLLAVAWFSIPCETTANGPHWGNRGIARGIMPYWPAQTDVGCLLLSLLSLLLFDRWLEGRRTRALIGAVAAFVAALLFKEHAVVLPLLAALLALYRRRPLRLVLLAGGSGLVLCLLFLLLRRLFIPGAWGPHFSGPGEVVRNLAIYLWQPATDALLLDDQQNWLVLAALRTHQDWLIAIVTRSPHYWLIVSALLLSACLALALYRPRRAWLYAVGALLSLLVPAQLLGGNIAFPTFGVFAVWLVRVTLLPVLLLLIWEQRQRGPALILLGCLVIVHLPVLHVLHGVHYYYWPVAWWSMLNAAVIVGLPGTCRATCERAKPVPPNPPPTEASADAGT